MFAQQLPLFDVPMVAPNRVRRRRVERGRQPRSMAVQLALPLTGLVELTPFERYVVSLLRPTPSSTRWLSVRCGVPERSMRYYLRRLESAGYARRRTPKGGWCA